MVYQTKKEQIVKFVSAVIIPSVKKKDLDYEKVIQVIMSETLCSRNNAEEVLKTQIPKNIKEIHVLTIPDENMKDWLEEQKEINKEIQERICQAKEQEIQ